MKIFELLAIHRGLLGCMAECGVRVEDLKYVDLFEEYTRRTADGEKATYVVATLVEKYGVCERKVYSVVKHSRKECNVCAAG